MKKIILLYIIASIVSNAHAQIKAITDQGKEVKLFDNGTWKYMSDSVSKQSNNLGTLTVNPSKFLRSPAASFLVKSSVFNIGVFINPNNWTFRGHKDNEKNPEYYFSLKSAEGYALLIAESIKIELDPLREIALLNAQKASFDIKETFAEYRIVNGKKVLCMEMKGSVKGLMFAYLGYYYSNENGTVQLISFAAQSQYDKIKQELILFLNGLTELEK